MRICMVFPGMLGELPPAITAAVALRQLGDEVTMVAAGCEELTKQILRENNVEWLGLGMTRYPRGSLGKARLRLQFGLLLHGCVRKMHPDVVWYHTAHAMEYRRQVDRRAPDALTVAHAHELYDDHGRLRGLQERTIAASACWIAPEKNRGEMLRTASSSRTPWWIVPNRPLETLGDPPNGGTGAMEVFRRHGGSPDCRRFVIYQGLIAEDRCLLQIVEAFRQVRGPELGLIILGDGRNRRFVERLRAAAHGDGRIAMIARIVPPLHLRVTAGADVGLLLYAPTSLNNLFCAPGKLFEYAWCGVGVVMPLFPSLTAITEPFGFGRGCDPLDVSSIAGAVQHELDREPNERRSAAAAFLRASPSPPEIYSEVGGFLRQLVIERRRTP
ncbi:MAG: hypothetical protein EPN53_04810 [Acidobacteria bacterium]|nr:MAG: hypothetical protein EPN53_04810 [Acidobacteriota bacterium]